MYKSPKKEFKECYGAWALVAGAAEFVDNGIRKIYPEILSAKSGSDII
jgi:hypothetical protein